MAYLGMYSIVMEAEFCTAFMEDPVKDDPENAAAGAARVRATRDAVFIFARLFILDMSCRYSVVVEAKRSKTRDV